MAVIGLTGGIATGKSTVGRMLEERGARLFSADGIAHEMTVPGAPLVQQIARDMGREFVLPDGSLDRAALGAHVFADPDARRRLEGITHPAILRELDRSIEQAREEDPTGLVVAEVPLLFEAGMEQWFDAVVTVTASTETQRARLMARTGLSPEQADARIRSQMPLSEKAAKSDYVLVNDGGLPELEKEVDYLLQHLSGM